MKGHSERVPNKNMKMFCGEPLYHAVMKSLEACDYVSEIVIDTDSDIIAEDAVRNFRKVRILRRPQELQRRFRIDERNHQLRPNPSSRGKTFSANTLYQPIDFIGDTERSHSTIFCSAGRRVRLRCSALRNSSLVFTGRTARPSITIRRNLSARKICLRFTKKTPISTFSRSIRFVPQETKESDCIPKCSQSTSWRPSTSTTKKILF